MHSKFSSNAQHHLDKIVFGTRLIANMNSMDCPRLTQYKKYTATFGLELSKDNLTPVITVVDDTGDIHTVFIGLFLIEEN